MMVEKNYEISRLEWLYYGEILWVYLCLRAHI